MLEAPHGPQDQTGFTPHLQLLLYLGAYNVPCVYARKLVTEAYMQALHMRAPHMQARNEDLALQSPHEAPALREHPVHWQTVTRQQQMKQRQISNRTKAGEGRSREDKEDRGAHPDRLRLRVAT